MPDKFGGIALDEEAPKDKWGGVLVDNSPSNQPASAALQAPQAFVPEPKSPSSLAGVSLDEPFPTAPTPEKPLPLPQDPNQWQPPTEEEMAKQERIAGQPLVPLGDAFVKARGIIGPEKPRPLTPGEQAVSENVRNTLNSLTTPENLDLMIGSLGVGSTGLVAAKLISALWTAIMTKGAAEQMPELAQRLGTQAGLPPEQRKPGEIADVLSRMGINTAFAVAPALHTARGVAESMGAYPSSLTALRATPNLLRPDQSPTINATIEEAPIAPETQPIPKQAGAPEAGLPASPDTRLPGEVAPTAGAVPTQVVPETGPGIVGLGGAVPAEFDPAKPFITSIKNAVVDQERQARGLPPAMQEARRSFGTVWDEAMKIADEHPERQDALIAELRNKPRAINDTEDALLLHRQIDLQNAFEKTAKQLEQHQADNYEPGIVESRVRLAQLSDDLQDIYDIGKRAGTETARGLSARRMLADEQFSLSRMTMAKRAANDGKPLTPDQQAEITRLHEKIAATQKAFDEYKAAVEAKQGQAGVQEVINRASKTKSAKGEVQDLPGERATLVQGIKDTLGASERFPELGSLIQKLAENFVRSGIKERNTLVDAVHNEIKPVLPPDWTPRDTMDAISGYGQFKPLNPDQIKAELRDLKGQMQQVAKLEDMQKGKGPLKTGIERRTPSDEERRLIKQVNEMKKKGGFTVQDHAKQLRTALDAIKTRLKNQIADFEYQIAKRTKIVKTKTAPPYDTEAVKLRTQRDLLKAQYDELFGKTELTDEQRIRIATQAIEKSIEEYGRRIKEHDYGPRQIVSRTPKTAELEALKARREALKEEYEYYKELSGPTKLSPEDVALKAYKTRAANRIAALKERVANQDFSKKPRRTVTLDTEAQKLAAENAHWKEVHRRDLIKDRLKNRTPIEKAQDALVKWRRAFILSSPVTLAKLTSAAAQRMTFTPIEEAIGGVISKVIPGVASKAKVEGGFSIRAEAKALTDGIIKGMQDSAQILRRGKSNLELNYGKGTVLPRSALDFMGELHAALKAPTKRNAFARAFQKQTEALMRAGVDTTDPLVQSRMAIEAYKSADRSIFMQDNRIVNFVKRGLSALEQPDKVTGKVPLSSKAMATTVKVLLPIVKVPTNIVAETLQYATGTVTGSARLGRALYRGVDKLQPEEADLILRSLKKGSLGTALLLVGYFSPDIVGGYYQAGEKRKPTDVKVGRVKVGDYQVPSFLLHNPLLETLQIGATIRRVSDSKLRKKDLENQGIGAGIMAGALGLTEEVPFVREMMEVSKAFDPHSRGAFFGELTKSLAAPQAVQWLAQQEDTDAAGETVKRKPETVLEHIKTGIPGLRQEVKRAKH